MRDKFVETTKGDSTITPSSGDLSSGSSDGQLIDEQALLVSNFKEIFSILEKSNLTKKVSTKEFGDWFLTMLREEIGLPKMLGRVLLLILRSVVQCGENEIKKVVKKQSKGFVGVSLKSTFVQNKIKLIQFLVRQTKRISPNLSCGWKKTRIS